MASLSEPSRSWTVATILPGYSIYSTMSRFVLSTNLVRFTLWPGQRHDSVGMDPILEGIDFSALLAEKAFESVPCG
jgi:hypothetical protein